MNRRICIGLLDTDPGWNVVLDQIGCDFELIDFTNELLSSYSCVILNSITSDRQLDLIQYYLEEGGIVIDEAGRNLYPHKDISSVYHQFIKNENEIFSEPFIDFYESLFRFKKADLWENTLAIEPLENGLRVFLGWPIRNLIHQDGHIRKKFYDKDHLFPNEIVAKTSKGAIRRSIEDLLIYLHSRQGLPFVKKPSSPKGNNSSFLFRIDTDYSDKETILKLYDLAHSYDQKFTWFLHVEAHREWLDVFSEMKDQEIALHGYEHGTSPSMAKNKQNIRDAGKEVSDSGMQFTGYCAPYGVWSKGLGEAIDSEGLSYSSEFTLNYDDLPFYPQNGRSPFKHLQIPIHPVCIGSFQRKRASGTQMKEYFQGYIKSKLNRNEPVVLYHHPLQDEWEVLDYIFKVIKEEGIVNMTFEDYRKFWIQRSSQSLKAIFDGHKLTFDGDTEYAIIYQNGSYSIQHLIDREIDLSDIKTKQLPTNVNYDKSTFKKLKTAGIRDLKLSFQDWMRRKRL